MRTSYLTYLCIHWYVLYILLHTYLIKWKVLNTIFSHNIFISSSVSIIYLLPLWLELLCDWLCCVCLLLIFYHASIVTHWNKHTGKNVNILYCTLHGRIKGTKCALFSIKCKGAVWKKSTVMKLISLLFLLHSAFQKVIIAFLHTSITLDSWLWTFTCEHFL